MILPTCNDHSKFGYVGVCEKCIMTLEAKYELARTDLARLQAENEALRSALTEAHAWITEGSKNGVFWRDLALARIAMALNQGAEKTPPLELPSQPPTPPSDPKGGT